MDKLSTRIAAQSCIIGRAGGGGPLGPAFNCTSVLSGTGREYGREPTDALETSSCLFQMRKWVANRLSFLSYDSRNLTLAPFPVVCFNSRAPFLLSDPALEWDRWLVHTRHRLSPQIVLPSLAAPPWARWHHCYVLGLPLVRIPASTDPRT